MHAWIKAQRATQMPASGPAAETVACRVLCLQPRGECPEVQRVPRKGAPSGLQQVVSLQCVAQGSEGSLLGSVVASRAPFIPACLAEPPAAFVGVVNAGEEIEHAAIFRSERVDDRPNGRIGGGVHPIAQ